MTNNARLKQLKDLDKAGVTTLAETRSCLRVLSPHERRMFISGFLKGFKAALHGARSLTRSQERMALARNGDAAWATGFVDGVKYVPVNAVSVVTPAVQAKTDIRVSLSPSEYRRMKKRRGVAQ